MRKQYDRPELRTQSVQLGIYGNYGGIDPTGTEDKPRPRPFKLIKGFDFMAD